MTSYADFAPMSATSGVQRLRPSEWPIGSEHLFVPRPFDASEALPVITRHEDVLRALLNLDGSWSRQVPLDVLPPDLRHRTLYASWGSDAPTHEMLRNSLRSINRGSTADARDFTQELTAELLDRLLMEPPPWDLSRVIYEVSIRLVIEHTLKAPPLFRYTRRLRELTRDHVVAPGGFFGIQRQRESEEVLAALVERRADLPDDGLGAYLVDLYRADPERLSLDQLVGQLWLLAVSSETQATATASLLGMLLEFGEYDYARDIVDDPAAMALLIDEGRRRGVVFPVGMMSATRPVTIEGQTVEAGRVCLASYAAANLDPRVFEDPLAFNPRLKRNTRHIAFGEGEHRCQGEIGADQFTIDVLTVLLNILPAGLALYDGHILRETGMAMSVAELPVSL